MIQGGDPQGNGSGGPGYSFGDEFDYSLKFNKPGLLAMANSGPATNGSHFFITETLTPWLDYKHTIFGTVVEGYALVSQIQNGDVIQKVSIIRNGKDAVAFDAVAVWANKDELLTKKKVAFAKQQSEAGKSFAISAEELVNKSYPSAKKTASGLYILVEKEGTGAQAIAGKNVKVHYTGTLADGTKFDSSYDRDQPLPFVLGQGQVIKGWDEGIATMKVGGKSKLIIPADLGYGANGAGGVIPPNATLIFDTELMSVGNNELIQAITGRSEPKTASSSSSSSASSYQQEVVKPAILTVSDIKFKDENLNDRIDGNEKCSICFSILNQGKGSAHNLKALPQNISSVKGINLENATIGSIEPNVSKKACVNVNGSFSLSSGTSKIKIAFEEKNGFQPDPIELSIETKEFTKPEIVVADHSFLSDNGSIRLGLPVQLKALIQNVGQGTGDNVSVQFTYPSQNVFPNSESQFSIGTMKAGERKELLFEFIANKLYTAKEISIGIKCTEKHSLYGEQKSVVTSIDSKSSGSTVMVASNAEETKQVNIERGSLSSEVDKNIPVSATKKSNAYALVIGNEDYTRYQSGLSSEANVEFAKNDANVFAQYAERTIGIPKENIVLLTDAIGSKMRAEIERVVKMAQLSKGEIYFYYAGHGLPDEASKEAYIMPVDISGSDIQAAIKLNELYKKLCSPGIQKATVFLDACFSGGGRLEGLVAARAVKIAPKADALPSNILVFTASSGAQISLPYKEKQHGMFTYYLLKKMQDSKGETTMKDLADYVKQNVPLQSLKVNSKEQSPNVLIGTGLISTWEIISFK
jgi:FKBP-type peptidyl-prolyl cis-trans isomerase